MKIKNISESKAGTQVVVETMGYRNHNIKEVIVEGDLEWPRMKAAGQQLKQDIDKLKDLILVRVDQKLSSGGLFMEQQFSFKR